MHGSHRKQGSDGGALEVKHGGEAMFLVPVRFAGNSVTNGYSGGALHVDGEVCASVRDRRAMRRFAPGGLVTHGIVSTGKRRNYVAMERNFRRFSSCSCV